MKDNRGFTLIEVMITVAIVAILATIAYPSYQNHVMKSQRSEGVRTLLEIAQNLERCYTLRGQYDNAACQSGTVTSEHGYYQVAIATPTSSSFTLTATPVAGAVKSDTKCGVYTLDQANKKTVSLGTVTDCW